MDFYVGTLVALKHITEEWIPRSKRRWDGKIVKYLASISAVAILALFASGANALTMTPSSPACDGTNAPGCLAATTNDNSNLTEAQVAALVGETSLTEVYKMDQGDEPADTGSFAGSYDTTFANTVTDPEDATITYDGSPDPTINCTTQTCYALVKDGNQEPAQYIFDISGWNGTDDLVFQDFWVGSGAISHVAIYTGGATTTTTTTTTGTPTTTTTTTTGDVAEPGALSVLGLGLLGLGLARRRKPA